jgi:ribosome hibernation promoting factor
VQIDYVGRSLDLTDEIRSYAEKKMAGVTRFLEDPVEIRLVLEATGHRKTADLHVRHRFGVLQAEEEGPELLEVIHEAIQKIEKQARRSRKKFQDKRRRGDRGVAQEWPVEVVARASVGSDGTPRVIKTSSLSIKPMTLDEAALKLETAKNDFIVFRDADHGRINVLYKRRDGDYGLVTPGA